MRSKKIRSQKRQVRLVSKPSSSLLLSSTLSPSSSLSSAELSSLLLLWVHLREYNDGAKVRSAEKPDRSRFREKERWLFLTLNNDSCPKNWFPKSLRERPKKIYSANLFSTFRGLKLLAPTIPHTPFFSHSCLVWARAWWPGTKS